MKGGRGNNEKFLTRKRAVNYKASRKPPTTNPRIAHVGEVVIEYPFVGLENFSLYSNNLVGLHSNIHPCQLFKQAAFNVRLRLVLDMYWSCS